jgi:hypothetical protein
VYFASLRQRFWSSLSGLFELATARELPSATCMKRQPVYSQVASTATAKKKFFVGNVLATIIGLFFYAVLLRNSLYRAIFGGDSEKYQLKIIRLLN